jgi:hypothetical protein
MTTMGKRRPHSTVRVRIKAGAHLKLKADKTAVAGEWIELAAVDFGIPSIRACVETEEDITAAADDATDTDDQVTALGRRRSCPHCFIHACERHPDRNVCCLCGSHAGASDDTKASLPGRHNEAASPLFYSCVRRNAREMLLELSERTRQI